MSNLFKNVALHVKTIIPTRCSSINAMDAVVVAAGVTASITPKKNIKESASTTPMTIIKCTDIMTQNKVCKNIC